MPHTIKSIIEKLSEEFNLSEEGEKKLKSSLTSLLDSIKTDIEKTKEEVEKQTGSYKYDDQYDDCINIINSYK